MIFYILRNEAKALLRVEQISVSCESRSVKKTKQKKKNKVPEGEASFGQSDTRWRNLTTVKTALVSGVISVISNTAQV